MRRDYLAPADLVSPFTDAKLQAYRNAGNEVQQCANGESGGIPTQLKQMLNPRALKAYNKSKAA